MGTMDPNSQDQTEQEQEEVPEIPLTTEDGDPENAMEEEQPEGAESAQEDENEAMPADAPVKEEKAPAKEAAKPTEKKGKGRPKKSSEKPKQPPSKKRKRSKDTEGKENEGNDDIKKENGLGDGDNKSGKGSGSGRKKGDHTESWTPEVDKVLVDAIKKHTNNNIEAVIPWKETYEDFQVAFPDSQRSLKALKMRWFQHLKHGEVELTEEQLKFFRQAVKDIDGNEKNAAIAWRYKQLSNSEINRGAVGKLLKSLNLGSNGN
ncbi:hypothetical protein TWF506_000735 [Arthrobotrys conoides]|uniref:Myb-like domain-containing protein n=1 Tax=Arthrobotrys conoides TaxID=74498 RepID=A0AAN8PR54_9PEZI